MDSKKEFNLFGGLVEIILYDIDESFAELFFEEIHTEALRLQKVFNLYDKDSELSKLNKKRKLKVSEELLEVLSEAIKYCKMTQGRYDISKGKNILSRKQGSSFTESGCTYEDIIIKKKLVSLVHKDVLIDLGSIAKGYIVDKLIEFMQNQGIESGYIDARGDISIFGDRSEVIGIQHPRKKDNILESFILENKSVATSGDYNQHYGSYETSHILGKKDMISVSVISDTLMQADVIATCISLLKQKELDGFILGCKDVNVICIDDKLNRFSFNDKSKAIERGVGYAA